jgi:hypothetical protein
MQERWSALGDTRDGEFEKIRQKNKAPLTQRVTGRPLNSPPPSAARELLYVFRPRLKMAPMGYANGTKEGSWREAVIGRKPRQQRGSGSRTGSSVTCILVTDMR